ncbi:MAG TPA: DUF2267 domain-containing protein [Micromonosporaceae bacterium]|nr:DUF2267 domain-containing protein [Micromonosporaceae bacterium]
MTYVGFLNAVAQRAGLPPEEAANITRATLETLAERISGGEARDLAAQLPEELRDYLRKDDELPQRLNASEFVHEVRARAGVDDQWASEGARAVFATLRDAVSVDELADVLSELPKDIQQLLQPASRRVEA